METITLFDGLILTIVSMVVVFVVLGAIWGLTEFTSRLFRDSENKTDHLEIPETTKQIAVSEDLTINPNNQKVAELMALVLASEDQPHKKFEILESKRIK